MSPVAAAGALAAGAAAPAQAAVPAAVLLVLLDSAGTWAELLGGLVTQLADRHHLCCLTALLLLLVQPQRWHCYWALHFQHHWQGQRQRPPGMVVLLLVLWLRVWGGVAHWVPAPADQRRLAGTPNEAAGP
jgi:hypothetical protein